MKVSSFLRNSFAVYGSYFLGFVGRLLLFRTVMTEWGAELFGIWGMVKGALLLPAFLQQAIATALFVEAARDREGARFPGSAMVVMMTLCGAVALIVLLLTPSLVLFFRVPDLYRSAAETSLRLAAMLFLLDGIGQVFLYILQGTGRFVSVAIVNSFVVLANSFIAIFFLRRGYGLPALLSIDVCTSFFLILAAAGIWKQLPGASFRQMFSRARNVKSLFREARGQLGMALSDRILWELDTLLVTRFFGVAGMTPYWIARRLPYLWLNFVWAGGSPTVTETAVLKPELAKQIKEIHQTHVALVLPTACLLWYFSGDIIRIWMGMELPVATQLMQILVVAVAIHFLPSSLAYHLMAAGKTNRLARITSAAAGCKVILAIVACLAGSLDSLIHSTLFGSLFFSITCFILASRETGIHVFRLVAPVFPPLIAFVFCVALFEFVLSGNMWQQFYFRFPLMFGITYLLTFLLTRLPGRKGAL